MAGGSPVDAVSRLWTGYRPWRLNARDRSGNGPV